MISRYKLRLHGHTTTNQYRPDLRWSGFTGYGVVGSTGPRCEALAILAGWLRVKGSAVPQSALNAFIQRPGVAYELK